MKQSETLVERLRTEGWDVPDEYEFRRLNPGRHGRAAGAWRWSITADVPGGPVICIGSPDTVSECLASPSLSDGPHGTIYAD